MIPPLRSAVVLGSLLLTLGLVAGGCSCDDKSVRKLRRKLRRMSRPERKVPPLLPARADDDRPNVILVSMDTTRADALGAYGAPAGRTPALDALAAEGTVFTRSWSQAPSTTATHASLFTGARIYEHGVMGHTQRLPGAWTTLAEHFLAEGYRTFALTSSARFRLGMRLHQGFHVYERFRHAAFADRSERLIERLEEELAHSEERPAFGFVHLMDPHAPYDSPEPWGSRYLEGELQFQPKKSVQLIRANRNDPGRLGARKLAQLQALYDGGISHTDDHLRRIRALIESSSRPTLLVVTADHGEAFAENGYLGHSSVLWEEVTRVPLVFWGPEVPAGARQAFPVVSADVMPTVAALAGVPLHHEVTGRDLSAVVRTGEAPEARDLVIQANHRWGVVRATETAVHKLIIDSATGEMVVHRADDPDRRESAAVVDDPGLRDSMLQAVQGQDLSRPSQRSELRTDIDEEELKQLQALGYLDAEEH
jgi:arylsulfatase A-like enzyme